MRHGFVRSGVLTTRLSTLVVEYPSSKTLSCLQNHLQDWLHDYICRFVILIILIVGFLLITIAISAWLVAGVVAMLPVAVLLCIGVPRIFILYSNEVSDSADLSIKVTGNQWYWSYDYSDFSWVEFDSFILPLIQIEEGAFRLLEVDNRLMIPLAVNMRFIIRSADVLHSWAVPSLGVKVDACPGRVNIVTAQHDQVGLFFGQCSEICGANHRFIPICLEVTGFRFFRFWIIACWTIF